MDQFIKKDVDENKSAILNTEKIPVLPSKKYRFAATVGARRGKPYAAYLAVFVLDSANREIARHIRWISDFSGQPKEYQIVFPSTKLASSVLLGYRINCETPEKGAFELLFPADFTEELLSPVSDNTAESSDRLTDYIKPLYLDKIAERLDRDRFGDIDHDLELINKSLESKSIKETWEEGIEPEAVHWTEYLLRRVRENESERSRLDPVLPISREMISFLPDNSGKTIAILDVGAGPLTTVGKIWKGHVVSLTALDPLAAIYDKVLDQAGIVPPVRTIYGEAERISEQFTEQAFDLVHCANALDHCYNPFKAIEEMLKVVKVGGYILLKHFSNEAEKENYGGFHQWNLWSYKNNFIIWNREGTHIVNQIFKHHVDVMVSESDNLVTVSLKKLTR